MCDNDWEALHQKFGCIHPPNTTYCAWCGYCKPQDVIIKKDNLVED